jgi:Fe-S-cluster containining protein
MPPPAHYDCQRCGACCVNPPENVREGYTAYVEVESGAALLRRRDLAKKLVVLDSAGVPHLRLAAGGRCLALAGSVGRSVRCTVYHFRPAACRRVEAGSDLCLRHRRGAGLDPDPI